MMTSLLSFSDNFLTPKPPLPSPCLYLIKCAHNTDERMTQNIPSKYTIVSVPEEKANSCQRDSECWRVPGACTCILTDDRVTSMMNAFDRDNTMLGRITSLRTLPFDNLLLNYTITTSKRDRIGLSCIKHSVTNLANANTYTWLALPLMTDLTTGRF